MFLQIAEAVKKENYEFDTLVLSVSLPAQLCVREVRVCVCLCVLTVRSVSITLIITDIEIFTPVLFPLQHSCWLHVKNEVR